jgi:hypothetical protein
MTLNPKTTIDSNFSDVDPSLLDESIEIENPVAVLASSGTKLTDEPKFEHSGNDQSNISLGNDEPKPVMSGRASRFFRKKD